MRKREGSSGRPLGSGAGLALALGAWSVLAAGCARGLESPPPPVEDPAPRAEPTEPADLDLARHVDPFIGTDDSNSPDPVPGGAGGSTFPGALAPFGMVQFSPDTPSASPSGYRYGDSEIEQFSLTHLNGAGCPNDEDLPLLPVVGTLSASPGTQWSAYRSRYDRGSQSASPGDYRVTLDRGGVRVELTATARAGFARFTSPATAEAQLLLHVGRSATGVREGSIEVVPPNILRGTVTAGGFCGAAGTFQLHFAAAFDRPFTGHGTWLGDSIRPGTATAHGAPAGGYVTFDTTANPTVQLKLGLSYVSVANAQANLDAEIPGWDFEGVRARTRGEWNRVLNRIVVSGGSAAETTRFYTALYRVFSNPNLASDVNGEAMGFDGVVRRHGRPTYQNYSGWDIIRSWTHLAGAIAPEAPDIVASMVQDGVERGLLPFWSHQNVETHVMVGDPGTVSVANAWAMGVRGFDAAQALALMKRSADEPAHTNRWGLQDWLDLHFVGNAAVAQEYAMADFALAQFARSQGDAAAAQRYLGRSGNWANHWNPSTGYLAPRVTAPGPGADAARLYEVEVSGPAAPTANLARGGTATASASCSGTEGPEKAINGTVSGGASDKWCDNAGAERWWQVDLGTVASVSQVRIHHAGAGGEAAAWNTRDFTVELSTDAATWTTAATISGNAADVSTHGFSPQSARYVRLRIGAAIQSPVVGAWDCQPFNPASDCGFIEGNATQYVWMVPHDLEGLFSRMGGRAAAVARLDAHFTELNAGTRRPFFYIGNEPEHGTPWTYNFAQAPWKTQEVVRRIIQQQFGTGPGGLPGNDDLGSTSAWLVWASLGLYPVIPGTDVLVLNGPFFPEARVRLANGNVLTLRGRGAGASAPFIQRLEVDGVERTQSWLRFADLAPGATLDFTLGAATNQTWGSGDDDVPPSYAP